MMRFEFAGRPRARRYGLFATVALASLAVALPAQARSRTRDEHSPAGDLLVSGSRFREADIQPGVTVLPPGCTSGCQTATADGAYPYVFNNDLVDSSFGIAAPILIERVTPNGNVVGKFKVPTRDLVTSFSSKSELGLNLSTSGRQVTFMGYAAPIDGIDISNSNTPGAVDPTNPVPSSFFRAVATLDPWGRMSFTETNAYSGNNGRAAILNDEHGRGLIYTAGNAGNGNNPQPDGVILGAGAQIMSPSFLPESAQSPGAPTPVASFNVTQLGFPADKIGKDDNFRGLTIFDNVLYYTKGSGSNGVDTVYFVDTTGKACPNGVGVPAPGAQLPTSPLAFDPATLQTRRAAEQHVRAARLPGDPGEEGDLVPVRDLVRQPAHAVRRRRGRRQRDVLDGDRSVHRRRRADPRGPPEVGARPGDADVEPRVHAPERAQPRPAVRRVRAIRSATTPPPACRGRRRSTACATSPAA